MIPHSMTVNGSVTTSGGTPSAGGGRPAQRVEDVLGGADLAGQCEGPRAGAPTAQEL